MRANVSILLAANLITTIRDGSNPDQWYHVQGAKNPGDQTSR